MIYEKCTTHIDGYCQLKRHVKGTTVAIRNLVAPPPNNTYVPFCASPRMCLGIELVKMETLAMIHLLPGIIIVALLLVNESVNAKNPTNPSDFSINSSIGNATNDASLSPPGKEENGCMA
ncbi:hypothetical protein Tco_0704591 [Tanacetum coccineum]|uniref:Uncharacterized protein n=1 Tax=Tanacetum coccineum TaxID=301880 RepID=A0ABQ4Y322_9ASTR